MKRTRSVTMIGVGLIVFASTAARAEAPKGMSASKPRSEVVSVQDTPGLSHGVDAIIAKIQERELELARRAQQIGERERAVVELESIIEQRSIELDRIRREIEERIDAWMAQGQNRVHQLASVYSAMPPIKAGELLSKFELDLAASIVRGMKKKSSANVLAAMRPSHALRISRRMLRPLDPATDAPAARSK